MNNDINSIIESYISNHDNELNTPHTVSEAVKYLTNDILIESDLDGINHAYNRRMALDVLESSMYKENRYSWPFAVAPFFTESEVFLLKDYYVENGYDESKYPVEFNAREYNSKMLEYSLKLSRAESEYNKDLIKQEMLNMGWNPELDYNKRNIAYAIERTESFYQNIHNKTKTIMDCSSIVESDYISDNGYVNESTKQPLKPIHVVIVSGIYAFSQAIKAATNSQFSHAAICIDNDFSKCYSYNLMNKINYNGGFSIEDIAHKKDYDKIAVYTFFVDAKDHAKIKERIDMLTENIKNTSYSIVNILTLPFKHINLNNSNSMICSQFVDSVLKMVNIDITKKDSSHITPADLYNSITSAKSSKIYKLYEGPADKFDHKKISDHAKKMSYRAKSFIGESVSVAEEYLYAEQFVLEVKAAIEFNKDGDMLLRNPMVNLDNEYAASHKLLVQYEKANNFEAMKYELARLYYMNHILEKNIYHSRFLKNKDKNIKTRARVLNDFNKYLKIVLAEQPNFNFGEYYEQSVFYPHTVEVKSGTLLTLKNIVDYIL